MNANDVMEIQVTMEECQQSIKDKEMVVKLIQYPEFQHIIGKLYYEEESVRLVGLMAETRFTEQQQENVKRQMYGVAFLRQFIFKILHQGQEAEQLLADASDELHHVSEA